MTKKLKIGFFVDTFYPMVDGVIAVVDNYAKRLCKFCDVTVFCPTGREKIDDKKFPYKVVRCTKKFPLKFLDYDAPMPKKDKNFLDELEKTELDIVHIHSPFAIGKVGVKYAKEHNLPIVSTMHSQYKQDFKKAVKSNIITNIMIKKIMKVFNSSERVWTVNDGCVRLFKQYGIKVPISIQSNATDMVFLNTPKEQLRKELNIKDEQKVFLFVGRLISLKNIFFIVKILDILNKNNFDFKMFFVGSGPDENKLKKYIEKCGLAEKVIITGKITDREEIKKYYKCADLFLFPSKYDTNSLVQIEAASQKTPTLFLKDTITASTVKPDYNGYVCENNASSFAQKIIEIFSDKKEYNKVCENAFKSLYVTWDDVVKSVYNGYQEIIAEYNKKQS